MLPLTTRNWFENVFDVEVRRIQEFIREHYLEMYELWETDSTNGFYEKRISTQRKH